MGALTSKPYTFKARSWELRVFPYYDLFSNFVSPLRIHIRCNDILRILPVSNAMHTFWIFDHIRFSYDSYQFQRLLNPFIVKIKFALFL